MNKPPEGQVTVTTICLDLDYLLDQVFWQHSHILRDRLDAPRFAETVYAEAAQVLRIGEARLGLLLPALDELVALSIDGGLHRFHRMQSLWFAIVDQIAPFIRVTRVRQSPSQRAHIRPTHPRPRRFAPTRPEARTALELLRSNIAAPWTLDALAERVYLSPKQLRRVFTDAFGKTPLAYLTMLRAGPPAPAPGRTPPIPGPGPAPSPAPTAGWGPCGAGPGARNACPHRPRAVFPGSPAGRE